MDMSVLTFAILIFASFKLFKVFSQIVKFNTCKLSENNVFSLNIPWFNFWFKGCPYGRPMKGNARQSTWILDATSWIPDSNYWTVFVSGVDNL